VITRDVHKATRDVHKAGNEVCPILSIYCSINTAGMNKLKIKGNFVLLLTSVQAILILYTSVFLYTSFRLLT
jgi:uncharacterized membrane protein